MLKLRDGTCGSAQTECTDECPEDHTIIVMRKAQCPAIYAHEARHEFDEIRLLHACRVNLHGDWRLEGKRFCVGGISHGASRAIANQTLRRSGCNRIARVMPDAFL